MKFSELYKSVFGILRVEGGNARIAGTGFLINTNPIYVLTCNHVVSEGSEENNGAIRYSVTKRTDTYEEFDLRKSQITFIEAKRVFYKPEFDVAILEIDPSNKPDIAKKLKIQESKPLKMDFDNNRVFGDTVEWLTPAAANDLTLTPRFFKGNITAHYITDNSYSCKNANGEDTLVNMQGIKMIEVDKLFIPGSSGSPILKSNKVIGFVHGFRSWPIPTNTDFTHQVQIIQGQQNPSINAQMKYKLPMITSLSLGIDVRALTPFLEDNNFLPLKRKWWENFTNKGK